MLDFMVLFWFILQFFEPSLSISSELVCLYKKYIHINEKQSNKISFKKLICNNLLNCNICNSYNIWHEAKREIAFESCSTRYHMLISFLTAQLATISDTNPNHHTCSYSTYLCCGYFVRFSLDFFELFVKPYSNST